MKKIGLFTIILLYFTLHAFTQTPGIRYQTAAWDDLVQQAATEKKLIFLNCHTRWCENCLRMEKEVLSQDSIIQYFNTRFINVTIDMGEPSGRALQERYNVQAFPTFLFINVRGDVVHRLIGYRDKTTFLAAAIRANSPKDNLLEMTKRYQAGECSTAFLKTYLVEMKMNGSSPLTSQIAFDYLKSTGLMQKHQAGNREPAFLKQYMQELLFTGWDYEIRNFVPVYLNSLSAEELSTPDNWKIFTYYTNSDWDESMKKVYAQPELFYDVAEGKDIIDSKLVNALQKETGKFMTCPPEDLDEESFQQFFQELKKLDSPVVPECLANLIVLEQARKGDYPGLMNTLDEVIKYNLFRGGTEDYFILRSLDRLNQCDDPACLKKGIQWTDQRVKTCRDHQLKIAYLNMKAQLLTRLGENDQAAEARAKAEEYKTNESSSVTRERN